MSQRQREKTCLPVNAKPGHPEVCNATEGFWALWLKRTYPRSLISQAAQASFGMIVCVIGWPVGVLVVYIQAIFLYIFHSFVAFFSRYQRASHLDMPSRPG